MGSTPPHWGAAGSPALFSGTYNRRPQQKTHEVPRAAQERPKRSPRRLKRPKRSQERLKSVLREATAAAGGHGGVEEGRGVPP